MHSPGIHTTPLHQALTKSPKLIGSKLLLESFPKTLNPEPLETLQITLIHHDLQDEAQLVTTFPDCLHPPAEKIDEFEVIWRIFATHKKDVLFGKFER